MALNQFRFDLVIVRAQFSNANLVVSAKIAPNVTLTCNKRFFPIVSVHVFTVFIILKRFPPLTKEGNEKNYNSAW